MSNRKGFTLIELLIVVVIIGILAAIAIPKFAATKDKAKLASIKSDIRNIETAEEAYFADNAAYGDYSAINTANLFTSSAGNVATIAVVGAGYTVSVTNATITQGDKTCAVAIGQGAANDGEITCS
jgi:prepilin-type N-terminal cleavage/methylation domain-containing protein